MCSGTNLSHGMHLYREGVKSVYYAFQYLLRRMISD